LTDAIPKADQKAVLQRIMEDKSIRQATFYFKFYLFQALKKTGMGDSFLPQLKPWHDMVANGSPLLPKSPTRRVPTAMRGVRRRFMNFYPLYAVLIPVQKVFGR
jgi:hypothetical protein